jgi:hypothetical protein
MTEAVSMLSELNAQEHEVYSGVCLAFQAGERESAFVETTRVRFKDLSDEARYRYLLRIGPLDKAGAYAAQDDAGEIIANVTGSFSNVVGLPMEAPLDSCIAAVLADVGTDGVAAPKADAAKPRNRNTVDRPSTKNSAGSITRRFAPSPVCISVMLIPPI